MEAIEDNGEVVCLYHIEEGRGDWSYALNVAKAVGIEQKLIDRAEEVYAAFHLVFINVMIHILCYVKYFTF